MFKLVLSRWALGVFALALLAAPVSAVTIISTDVPQGIWDFNTTVSTINAPGYLITDINVHVTTLYHSWMGDLVMWIESPSGTTVSLFERYGGPANNMIGTIFDDSAAQFINEVGPPYTGTFRAPGALSAFNGENAAGVWRLYIRDDAGADSGSLQAWALEINGTPSEIPEPATFLLVGLALAGAALSRKRY